MNTLSEIREFIEQSRKNGISITRALIDKTLKELSEERIKSEKSRVFKCLNCGALVYDGKRPQYEAYKNIQSFQEHIRRCKAFSLIEL